MTLLMNSGCAGNDFSTLFAPLIRDGRMEKFYWKPNRVELLEILTQMYKVGPNEAGRLPQLCRKPLRQSFESCMLQSEALVLCSRHAQCSRQDEHLRLNMLFRRPNVAALACHISAVQALGSDFESICPRIRLRLTI